MVTTERKTKEARREDILDAAFLEFAERGLHGASTEAIATRAGISQPYVFRLFGTKKELFRAVVARCFRETLEMFQRAAEGLRGEEALEAMGEAYMQQLLNDPVRLRGQMQAYAACDDPDMREVVTSGVRRPRRLRRAGLGAAAGRGVAVLRDRDADERLRLDGPVRRPRRALGAAAPRGLQVVDPSPFFQSEVSDESQNTTAITS